MRLFVRSGAFVLAIVAAAPAAAQQPRPERPYRGLFASGISDWEQLLTVSGSLGGGYGNDLLSDALRSDSPLLVGRVRGDRGATAAATGAIAYSLGRGRIDAGLSAASSTRYYPSLGDDVVTRHNAGAGLSFAVFDWLSVRGDMRYQPYRVGSLLPALAAPGIGESEVPDLDLASTEEHRFSYSGSVGLNRGLQLSRRSSVSASYRYNESEFPDNNGRFTHHVGNASLTFLLGRGLNLNLGYGYGQRRGHRGTRDARVEHHNLIAGVNYNRALSFSRRTTLSVSSGSTATRTDDRLRYHAIGSARLNHEIGRTWSASLAYSRDVHFLEIWPDPVFADSVALGFGGQISRRLAFQSSARTALGDIGFTRTRGFRAYQGTAGLSFALSRHIGMGLGYAYTHYEFDDQIALPGGWLRDRDRHRVSAQVNVWAPLIYRSRRPDAAR